MPNRTRITLAASTLLVIAGVAVAYGLLMPGKQEQDQNIIQLNSVPSDWKTYKHEEAGFLFKYSPGWGASAPEFQEVPKDEAWRVTIDPPTKGGTLETLDGSRYKFIAVEKGGRRWQKGGNKTPQERIERNREFARSNINPKFARIRLDGRSAELISDTQVFREQDPSFTEFTRGTSVYVPSENIVIYISASDYKSRLSEKQLEKYETFVTRVLSSFRFINK